MPIGDLLASITGEKPPPSISATNVIRAPVAPPAKRKADNDVAGTTHKVQRTAPTTNGAHQRDGEPTNTPRPAERSSYLGSAASAKLAATPRSLPDKPVSSSTSKKPVASHAPSSPRVANGSRPPASSTSTQRPPPGAAAKPNGTALSKAPPKKGSYAEIMARASRAQATMGSVGKIQHKSIEKLPSKRDREESKAEQARTLKKGVRPGSLPANRHANGLPSKERDGDRHRHGYRTGTPDRGRDGKRPGSSGRGSKATPEEERKIKKAALATTGYTGTARPPPGAASKAASSSKHDSGTQPRVRDRERDRRPFGAFSVRPRRSEDYDEEMDDFIVDDEDDDVPEDNGQQYRYADSEDESDMEAGLSDIDQEERRAEFVARREDAAEEALEKRMKREKEERKRKLYESIKSKRR